MTITIKHFNDCYKLESTKAGYARFYTLFSKSESTLNLFSGDVFNPSLESTVTRGKHMIEPLNSCNLDAACFGNHDFDFGIDNLIQLTSLNNFPWLCANIKIDGKGIANSTPFIIKHAIDSNGYPISIGIIGLAEQEWLSTIPQMPPVEYLDFVDQGELYSNLLRKEHMCTIVIALTHMRLSNDTLLANKVPGIDLVLGGHDHFYHVQGENVILKDRIYSGNVRIVKSGCDFNEFSIIKFDPSDKQKTTVEHVIIDAGVIPNISIQNMIKENIGQQFAKLCKPIAKLTTPFDTRSLLVRTSESNVGDFACDVLRHAYDVDIAYLCGGAIRSDALYQDELSLRDLMDIFPFEDGIVVKRLTGKSILDALEHGVSSLPKTEGRFPQVSGLRIKFDSSKLSKSRIVSVHVVNTNRESCTTEKLDLFKSYTVATRAYLANGGDGYTAFTQGETVISEEDSVILSAILRRFFLGIKTLQQLQSSPKRQKPLNIAPQSKWKVLVEKSLASKRLKETKGFLPVIDVKIDGRLKNLAIT